MNARLSRWSVLSASALLAAMGSTAVRADDTEVYTGQPNAAADGRPNIMFIIDTSGSMGTNVQHAGTVYDPNTDLYGSPATPRYVYWKTADYGANMPVTNAACALRDSDDSTAWCRLTISPVRPPPT